MGLLRNGAIPVEYQVAITLRWLAGGSIFECMDGHVIARSTAFQITSRVIDALNACPELDCKWPEGEDVRRAAELFRNRSTFGVIRKCVGAMDGLFIRLVKPTAKETAEPNIYFSGHQKGFGMNFQVRAVMRVSNAHTYFCASFCTGALFFFRVEPAVCVGCRDAHQVVRPPRT